MKMLSMTLVLLALSFNAAAVERDIEVKGNKVILVEDGVPLAICSKPDEGNTLDDCKFLPAGDNLRLKPYTQPGFSPAAFIKTATCTEYYCRVIRWGPYLVKVTNCGRYPCPF